METFQITRGQRITASIAGIISALVIAVALVIPLAGGALSGSNRALGDFGAAPAPTASSTPTATPSPTPTKEEDEYVIKLFERGPNGEVIKGGIPEAIRGDAKASKAWIAEAAKKDPVVFFMLYSLSPLAEKKPIKNESVLAKDARIEDGNTYSARGIRAYEDWLVLWDLSAEVIAVPQISFTGTNTGVSGTTVVQSDGVRGDDQSGVDVVYRDAAGKSAAQHSILNRCLNATGGKPSFPPGKTDNPPPPEEETPPDDSKRPSEDPSQTGSLPTQQQPNQLPARQDHFQPTQPSNPPRQYTPPPAAPPPAPAPVPNPGGGDPIPAPDPEPTPVITPPVEAPPGPPPSTCAPAPGETTC